MPTSQPTTPVIPTLPNLRDLGGKSTGDGRRVRPGILFRSVDLSRLDEDGTAAVVGLGIRTVYDLRTAQESEQRPDRVPEGMRRVELDVLADASDNAAAQLGPVVEDPKQAERILSAGGAARVFRDAYRDLVSLPSARRSYRGLFRGLLDDGREPALFHCTTGKDRTGWGAASLLLALGVDEDEVRADYLRTNDDLLPALRPLFDRFEQAVGDPELLEPVLGVREEYLDTALDEARARFDGIDGYVRDGLGLSDDEIDRLGETLLEDA
ncbi:tyrosine-protein phosphatase [Brachybacterium huguangmaarense]|uniref:Tyrosine-protein phosphatase n=1 Tax=Brachybacterium huguangmaarense TaxID=1652028 RepID=A0ABY6FYR4_9MICO|nr:tyrosine-protein phosphatase [Brachybacterium huguangmaarense]UYG16083.1 tyrosine-protein phosphatase [Brachybacterium huguangmaarense]